MKKLLAILLGSAMFAAAFAGLAACKPDEEEPNIKVPEITRRADTRAADAYAAYDNSGTKVGDYKTIADAINAVVEADLDFMEDDATPAAADGGYVTKKGGTRRLFQNKKGFADGNADQFWYYENGTMLEGYNCWDNTTGLTTLHNTKVITHKVNLGNTSRQSWNGYGLLDENGQEVNDGTLAQTWELSSTMDAGVMMFPKRKVGAAGLKYKIDLSEVKITPTYDGVKDPVYAFIGFYMWQDYYVIATGIACDTSTGQWYEFRGTSRDNSFSDVEYKMGECFMESTWNEGGYFTPNSSELEMQIQTKRMIDDTDGETYWVDDMTIAAKDGKTLTHQFDDEVVNQYFPGNSLAADNGFVFIAGLDVKNEIANGADVKNVDFFNGAKFENLCVTEAAIYFPTEEEMTDVEYSIGTIKPELRGKWNDALLANSVSSDGAYDYTILNNYACSTYTAKNGADYYDFKFDASPVAESELGGKLKTYQDTIDSLKNMTVENVAQYTGGEGAYTLAGKMYGTDAAHTGSTLTQQYLLLLDFAPYVEAQKVYEAAMKLSDEAKAVREGFDALGNLANYTYKGWTTEETDVAGYIWSEAQKFNELNTKFKSLSDDEQGKVISLIAFGESGYDAWDEFYTSVNTYLTDTTATGKSYTIAQFDMPTPAKTVTYDGTQALQKLFEIAYDLRMNKFDGVPAGEEYTFDSDNTGCYQKSFHVLFLMKKIEEAGVTIPDGFLNNVYAQLTSTARSQAFADDFNDYIYPVLTLAGQIYAKQQAGEFVWLNAEIAKVVNDHMVGFENFGEAGFSWNFTNNKDFRDGNTFYEQYFGLPDATTTNAEGTTIGHLIGSVKYVTDIVLACDDTAELCDSGLGFKTEVTALTEDPSKNGSDAAKAVVTKIQALTALEGYEYKGWTTTETDKTGYIYSELEAFRALVAEREALPAVDKAYVNYQLGLEDNETVKANYEVWVAFSDDVKALEDSGLWSKTLHGYAISNAPTDYTTAQALDQLFYSAYLAGKHMNLPDCGDVLPPETGYVGLADENSYFTATWAAMFYQYFVENNAEELIPEIIVEALKNAKFDTYYDEVFNVFYRTVKLANRIASTGEDKIEKMEDLTADELAYLNEVWTASYKISDELNWNWNDPAAQKFQLYWKARCNRVILIAGGNLKDGETPYLYHQYMEVIANFLQTNHYTIKENGWGTTAKEILHVTLTEEALELVSEFEKIGNLDIYTAKGWKAPEGTEEIKGYLYDEAKYYSETIKAKIAALTEDEIEAVSVLVGVSNYEDWATLSTEILALDEETVAIEIAAADSDAQQAQSKTYTVGEALGELLAVIAKAKSANVQLDFDGGIHNGFAFRAYYFWYELNDLGVDIPEVIVSRFESVELSDTETRTLFTNDIKYIITVMKIAKAITADANHVLTEKEIEMINATMVGKDHFEHGGFKWSYVNDGSYGEVVSWHAASKGYKVYFGFTTEKDFNYYQELVIKYLVEKYHATALMYKAPTGKDPALPEGGRMMGITEEISAPAAE